MASRLAVRRPIEGATILRGYMKTRVIFWLAAAVAILGAMVSGVPGGLVWAVALLAALIMVRRSWPKGSGTEPKGSGTDKNETGN